MDHQQGRWRAAPALHHARLAGTVVSSVAHAHTDDMRLRWHPPRRGPIYIHAVIVGSQWHLAGGRHDALYGVVRHFVSERKALRKCVGDDLVAQ